MPRLRGRNLLPHRAQERSPSLPLSPSISLHLPISPTSRAGALPNPSPNANANPNPSPSPSPNPNPIPNQELSLDNEIDSPFAILAKDNDICWGGGRPDDITVIVSRVIDPTEEEPPPSFSAFTGPGTPPPAITELPALKDTL